MKKWYQIDEIQKTIKQNLALGCSGPVLEQPRVEFDTLLFKYTVPEQLWVEFDTPLFQYTVPEQPRVNWMTSER